MKPAILALMAVSLLGCRREINVNIDIKIIDTGDVASSGSTSSGSSGGSTNQPSSEPAEEPSFEPSGEPSGDPNGGGDDPNGDPNDPNGGGGGDDPNDPNGGGGGDDPNDPNGGGGGDDPNDNPNDPNGGGGNNGGGQQEGGGPDFCSLVQTYIDCGDSSAADGLDYCDDAENAGGWLNFFDCLVEAGGTDCSSLSQCSGSIP
ncbi:MAG: hypothetical protein VX278_11400 [Myxococcota bacterium]|nr:hypothetical protein [Myxococcota bacterium]